MTTPICDFVRQYAAGNVTRLHMPGHKGTPVIGVEQWDITEINGAVSILYTIFCSFSSFQGSVFGKNQ